MLYEYLHVWHEVHVYMNDVGAGDGGLQEGPDSQAEEEDTNKEGEGGSNESSEREARDC